MSGWACGCTSEDCRKYGCQCAPENVAKKNAAQGVTQRGCICPPGSEATCAGINCPRRGYSGHLVDT